MMKRYVVFGALATLSVSMTSALATCTLQNGAKAGSVSISFNTDTLDPGVSAGTQRQTQAISATTMAAAMGISSSQRIAACTADESFMMTDSSYPLRAGDSPGNTGYIETGIPNLYMYIVYTPGTATGILFPTTAGGDYTRAASTINFGLGRWLDIGNATIFLYQAGKISQGGVVPAGILTRWRTSDGVNMVDIILNSFVVNVKSCQLTNNTPTVSLGDVHVSHFNGIGSSAGNTGFTLGMNCDSSIKPTITFTGVSTNHGTVLPLNNLDAFTTASGVGLELLYGQNKVTFGEALSLGATTNGLNNYTFTARYVQTESSIKAGEANATANFTINYE
ncbi:fimbrial protein [Enterobacter sp. UPMP2060]